MAQSLIFPAQLGTYAPGRRNLSVVNHRQIGVYVATYDPRFGGEFVVRGTTTVAGTPDVPVSRLVALFEKRTRSCARIARSDSSGAYVFSAVAKGGWFVIAFDHTGEYNAVIADDIFGEPM